MLFFFLLIFLSCSLNFVWTATPYTACESELGTIKTFDVTGCTTVPCKFLKGKTYTMNLTFQSQASSITAKVSIHGIIAGMPIPFPLPDPDACKLGVQCPINNNDINTASLSLPVLSSYPSMSLHVKIEIIGDDKNHDYACLKFPATITSGSKQLKKFIG
ncbi:unnamed protein product [Rotaria sp. Silwood2]|nr:unnamed protein product [Rotaria sp. Silwood2]CAF2518825.1 unnamed protein product [Rotaria sp. Silwood2]CAF2756513.1 unnamed protein product [Rotaria sp. Silwood2]CAF2916805.1 unnamed protein product [Rotaria sp. Silwood2]CAF4366637.1 unnamed protein product [Rotaria sp. Silwood2]